MQCVQRKVNSQLCLDGCRTTLPARTIAVGALAPGQGPVNSPAELLSRPMFRTEFGT